MMEFDIRRYDARRKVRSTKLVGAERQPNGRVKPYRGPVEHMVYMIQIDGNPYLKVGRTSNIARRVDQYRHGTGCDVYCRAQFVVASEDDAKNLERHVVQYAAVKFSRSGREWFNIPEMEFPKFFNGAISESPVRIVECRGAPDAKYSVPLVADEVQESLQANRHRFAKRFAKRK